MKNWLHWLLDKEFLRKIGVLAIPIASQEVLTTLLQFIDSIMVSYIDTASKTESGESIAIASVTFAGNNFFLFILLLVGITSGISIFTAQLWGNKDINKCKKSVGASLLSSIISSLFFLIPTFLFAEDFVRFFTTNEDVIKLGSSYLKIILFAYPFMAVTFSLSSSLKSIANVKLPITISIIGVLTNTVLNYLLIFGNFGAPKLGVQGAAIATVVAKILESFLLISSIYLLKNPIRALSFNDYFTYPKGFIKKLYKTTLPVVGNEMGWALGIFMYNKIYALRGTDAASAFAISDRVSFLFLVGFIGTASATAILIGNTIGANKINEAKEQGKRIIILAPLMALAVSLITIISAPIWSTHIFHITTGAVQKEITLLIIATAIIYPFKIINLHGVNGILRSGGDTHFSMFTDIGCLWGIGVPIGYISAVVFKMPVYWVYLLIGLEEIIKSIIIIIRIKKDKWLHRVTENSVEVK